MKKVANFIRKIENFTGKVLFAMVNINFQQILGKMKLQE